MAFRLRSPSLRRFRMVVSGGWTASVSVIGLTS
jgi:hypothetical protein